MRELKFDIILTNAQYIADVFQPDSTTLCFNNISLAELDMISHIIVREETVSLIALTYLDGIGPTGPLLI